VLNVPVRGMEKLVIDIAASSKSESADNTSAATNTDNKFAALGIPICRPGWFPLPQSTSETASSSASIIGGTATVIQEGQLTRDGGSRGGGVVTEKGGRMSDSRDAKKRKTKGKTESKKEIKDRELDDNLRDNVAIATCVAHVECRIMHRREIACDDDEDGGRLDGDVDVDGDLNQGNRMRLTYDDEDEKSKPIYSDSETRRTTSRTSSPKQNAVMLHCQIERVWVQASHWNGKNLISSSPSPSWLKDLGSQSFAYVVQATTHEEEEKQHNNNK
jgi:hypothetical protein